jgi:hypothetical protein
MGHRITEIIQFIQYKKGAFHFKEMMYNTLAALVTLGTGFPVGGFTPAVYLGGSMGALMAKWFKRKKELSRVFAASGATAATHLQIGLKSKHYLIPFIRLKRRSKKGMEWLKKHLSGQS